MAHSYIPDITNLLEYYAITFEQDIEEEMKCIICKKILKNAKQTPCGCRGCEKCFRFYLGSYEKPCPCCVDKTLRFQDIGPDTATNREISNLIAKCPFEKCNMVDSLRNLLAHKNLCEYGKMKSVLYNKKKQIKGTRSVTLNSNLKRLNIIKTGSRSVGDLQSKDFNINLTHESLIKDRTRHDFYQKKGIPVGFFTWNITNYSLLKQDAETSERTYVRSDPFYSKSCGYKMCLRIHPAGNGVGLGTHLSVFFEIIKGSFDDILMWPFEQKVAITLIDQEKNGANNHVVEFKPQVMSDQSQRTVGYRHFRYGWPQFIPLSSLLSSSVYYKDDSLVVKVAVY